MRHKLLAFLIGCVTIVGMAAAFATGASDEAADETGGNVFFGELDLAERMEIWRNQYWRMTPGDESFVQDVGTWPAAWGEFGRVWDAAPAERDLATWLVPFSVERIGLATLIRDANGTILWNGTTDFAKDESADVTLTGELVDESDWALWEAARTEIERRIGSLREPEVPMRGYTNCPCTTGLHFVSASADFTNTPPSFIVGLLWTNNGTVDMFAYGPLHTSDTHVVTYTNDENEVVTWTNTVWHCTEPTLTGRYDNLWELVGTLSVSNTGTNVFIDTNFPPGRAKVRYYAAFETGDADNDGLNDAFETTILGTSTNSTDSDNDGISDWDEYHVHRTDPSASDSDHDGIDDPTELAMGLSPNNPDTDGDGGRDDVDPSPGVSNVWWVVSKTTNEWATYGYHFLGNQTSWPTNPVWQDQLVVTGSRPHPDAIPGRVTLWGLVDDAITVDGNQIEGTWTNGAKVFSNLDVTASITNLASGTFRIDLYDWPDLPDGGPNEVRLGREDYPFRAVWEWWVPIEMYLEPIWANPSYPLENPSGILLGSNGWFIVSLEPSDVVPANKIVWTSDFNKVSFPGTGLGVWVESQPVSAGDDAVRVMVEDAIGDFGLPPFHVRVVAANVVTAKVGVVTQNGIWAMSSNQIMQVFAEANAILAQAGIQIEVDTPFTLIPSGSYYWNVETMYNMYRPLLDEIPAFGGLKIYFVHSITMPDGGYGAGVTVSHGTMIAHESSVPKGITLAHEVCHVCGLRDLYPSHSGTAVVAEGEIRPEWMPSDWGNYEKTGGTEQSIQNFMRRLLMYWMPESCDIPSGEVYGVWYSKENNVENWHLGNAPVGLSGMTNNPVHQ